MIRKILLSLLVAACGVVAQPAQAAEWSDNAIRYWVGTSFKEPGVGANGTDGTDIAKNVFSFTHASGYKYGGNFLNVDVLLSSSVDNANNSNAGAAEIYAVYRTDLSFNRISGSKMFSFGPVRDVLLIAGADLSAKNTAFAAHVMKPVAGLALSFDVPGFLNIGALAEKEWNNNGLVGKGVEFDATLLLTAAWGIPLGTPALEFEGFANVILPKGNDGFGNPTKTEVLLHPKLMGDVGALWGNPKSGFKLGVGFEYWLNKFGNDKNNPFAPGSEAKTPFLEAQVHL